MYALTERDSTAARDVLDGDDDMTSGSGDRPHLY